MSIFKANEREELYLYGIRALACIAVIVHHCCIYFEAKYSLVQLGRGAVGIFLVLSGYLLTGQLKRELNSTGSLNFRAFYLKRILRILPVTYVAIFFAYCLNRLLVLYPDAQYWTSFTFLLNIIDLPVPENILHFWSLCVEMHCYVLLPLLLFSLRTTKVMAAYLYGAAFLAVFPAIFLVAYAPDFQAYTTYTWAWAVLLGAAAAYKMPGVKCLFFGIFISIVIILVAKNFNYTLDAFRYLLGLIGLLLIQQGSSGKLKFLSTRPMVILGKLSFSLYVYQQFVFSSNIPKTYFALAVVLCGFFTYASYRWIEVPCHRLRKRIV